jgi:hypothetical protein
MADDQSRIVVTELRDLGDDRLQVRGVRGDQELEAYGWVSAITHHFGAEHYQEPDDTGAVHRRPEAEAREMTRDEALEYARGLLDAQNPLAEPPRERATLGHRDDEAEAALARVEARRAAEDRATDAGVAV